MRQILLAALILLFHLPPSAAQAPRTYLFSYFTNNGEDGLHFLSSEDGATWLPVNGGRSFLYPHVGSGLMRDPSIARGPDGTFHLVWTTGWWDKGIGIAHSKDLIDWSPQQFLPVMADKADAQNCWAPEIFYDEDNRRYLIFWATTMVRTPDASHRIYYTETTDFVTYSPAKILYDDGFSVIDAVIVKSGPGRFTMIMKDETALPSPKKHLRMAEASRADGPYSPASPPISVDWVEGPSVVRTANAWIVYYDEYTRRRYGALQSRDLKTWQPVEGLSFPRGVRHGSAFEVDGAVAAALKAHSTESTTDRWRISNDILRWPAESVDSGPRPHDDHIEMSGRLVSTIVQYGVDRDGTLMLWRRGVWPMLRTIPNNTGASLQQAFGPADVPRLVVDGHPIGQERLRSAKIDGTLALNTEADGLQLQRTIFPSRDRAAFYEKVFVANRGARPVNLTTTGDGLRLDTDVARGVYGAYTITASLGERVEWTLQPGETRAFTIVYAARRSSEPSPGADADAELSARQRWVLETSARMVLGTVDSLLSHAFTFAKIRATESIFATRGGLMHGPGGGRYYAAIWANDQAEYANPFFAFLGPGDPRESAMNAFMHFARFMNPNYDPIPSSIIAEGTGTWNGAKDRGDQAMIAYGAGRFALASGDRAQAERLWPLIEWCLEYLKRKETRDGVIASDSDELEGRFPAGSANLNTASLTYDALLSAAFLGADLGKSRAILDDYRARAARLRSAIERHFGARIDGFDTYRYYDGNTTLRAWIATPLTVRIYDRAKGTTEALFSPRLWTKDGLATEAGRPDFWDRSTLYALRGAFAAGDTDRALEHLHAYTRRRLLGEHVPYPVEAYPEGNQAHLSAESALYCRVFVEGLFGLRPTGLSSFTLTPRLPSSWPGVSLSRVRAFGRQFSISVSRRGDQLRVLVNPDTGPSLQIVRDITPGETIEVRFPSAQ
jgi:hypothetical protein